ncbi:MAG: T9SS type A sorting domain-containing protein [Bacteroidetes bacterium]|nr:T9SS type A sorting domain-containing protein [Bacteroidota bacterium]
MKKTITTLIMLLLLSAMGFSQFVQIPSGTTSDINSIGYSSGKLFFLGHNYLSSSVDLGNSITQLNIPLNLPYNYGLNVLDTSNLYLISGYHNPYYQYEIIHTSDGGMNWTILYDTIGTPIHDLTANENGSLLAVGNFGNIFKSQDGINWTISNANNITTIWNCVGLTDSSYAISGFEYSGISEDYGNIWHTTYFNISHSSSIVPISPDTIYMSSYFWNGWESFFSKSIDGGNSWTTNSIGTGIGIFDMSFESSAHGFAVGAKYNYPDTIGILMETTDGGATWTTYTTTYTSEFLSVKKVENHLFITGTNGIILKADLSSLSTQDLAKENSFNINIYPNPIFENSPVVVIADKPGDYKIEVLDIAGRKFIDKKFNTEFELTIGTAGVYLIRITDKQSCSITKKLIINN